MDLVINQVMQLEHVHDADRDLLLEGFTGPAIVQGHLAVERHPRTRKLFLDLVFVDAFKNRRCHGDTVTEPAGQAVYIFITQFINEGVQLLVAVEILDLLAQLLRFRHLVNGGLDLLAEEPRGEAEMGLENLTDVHTGRNTERVEDDFNRSAVFHVGHILFGQNTRQNALVTMTAGHLVTNRELALDGDVDLDHLDHARRQVIATLEFFNLVGEDGLDDLFPLTQAP